MTTNLTAFACPAPFLNELQFGNGGYVEGRLCMAVGEISCCLPCPLTAWAYPDNFDTMGIAADWVAVASTFCCVFLLLSWLVLPIDKTHRHYLSICLTFAVVFMNLGFVIPLAGNPEQCYDSITPNDMQTSSVCAASGTFIVIGGWAGVLWIFLRSLSLHLQICWQVVVGRNFMWFSHAVGWGLPALGIILALTLSGVSFRFGATCHINHENSLADLWIPLLVFAGLTIIIQFATFGYCIKVYLASLADNNATTENSAGLPSYTNSIRTMTPRQAYRRVRRVIQLQWRGIAIVLIIIADVVFFAVVFVFQDNTIEEVKNDPQIAEPWINCLLAAGGDKNKCLDQTNSLVVNMATIGAVLVLLAMNGIWLLVLLGRWSMVTGWVELFTHRPSQAKREFVSVDARLDDMKMTTDPRSYEMLSRDSGKNVMMDGMVTPDTVREGPIYPPIRSYLASTTSPPIESPTPSGRRTPDYFGPQARYQAPVRSFSSPRPPTREGRGSQAGWEATATYSNVGREFSRSPPPTGQYSQSPPPTGQYSQSPPPSGHYHQDSYGQQDMNPLGMNRI
ncbi:Frizzled/smoothened-like sans CRD protein B [Cytospora mali]|uniref:Frizzled/smoothened-like sans CRD protein B n=1 Tax=Cytospora mali TaxID=578113 RepID=A0A194UXY3_CYTMA|nr:Frizzled/smoothened-like sans CRD protein B [Valsa mali var. pyri (nom. inval.)]